MTSSRPLLLKVEEAGACLSIGRTKTWELVARGEIPSVRIGRSVRIPTAALEQWIEQRTEGVAR